MERSREIQDLTKFNAVGFGFTDTFHDLVGNRGFGEGYNRPNEYATHYIWDVLSAIGEGIGAVLYSNVLHYTDLVANVDTCKTKQLQSFLQLFGMELTVYDGKNPMPVEIQSLVDTLSISKKYLFRSPLISEELKAQIEGYSDGHQTIVDNAEQDAKWVYQNIPNSFVIQSTNYGLASSASTDCKDLYGEYRQAYDGGYTITDPDVVVKDGDDCTVLRVYQNDRGASMLKMADLSGNEYYALSAGMKFVGQIADAVEFENQLNINTRACEFELKDITTISSLEKDVQFIQSNSGRQVSVKYVPSKTLSVDTRTYSDEEYRNFVKDTFLSTLQHFINLPYNTRLTDGATHLSSKPIYTYQNFWNEYHNSDVKYEEFGAGNDNLLEQKRAYNIDCSFDEQGIVDDIEEGRDSLDNYSSNEQAILNAEMQRRAQALNFSELEYPFTKIDGSGNVISYEPYTRYSYYRYRKVKEYIDFVESHLYSGEEQIRNAEYSYDTEYIVKSNSEPVSILRHNGDEVELDNKVVESVAEQLANIVQYICKLREQLKIQIRKNYIKGTSNLLRFVVNEYIQDFGRNCGYFTNEYMVKNVASSMTLQDIYNKLVSHSIDDVEVIEYVDTTEYFNIETDTTKNSITKNIYNPDYFAEYFSYDKDSGKVVQTKNPYELDIGEIRSFYLSSLKLQEVLESEGELNDYLSVVYDVGKSRRYIDEELSILVCGLVDGRNTRDMYLMNDAATKTLNQLYDYLDAQEYEFKQVPLSDQIDDILSSVVFTRLSSTYLSDYTDVYDRYIDGLSDQYDLVAKLNSEYSTLLSSDMAYYFTKSTTKYCYTDNDRQNGTYKHDYLYENPAYETSYVLAKIQNLKEYSTDENIQNHSILDAVEYLKTTFATIYYGYCDSISSYLSSLGYRETTQTSFGDVLSKAKSFATSKKEQYESDASRKWEGFIEDANDLQTQYATQEAAFTSLVGKYSGDSEFSEGKVYCFSGTKCNKKLDGGVTWDTDGIPEAYCARSTKALTGSGYEVNKSCTVDGITYYYYRKPGWSNPSEDPGCYYPYWIYDVEGEQYSASDPIRTKCNYLKNYLKCKKFCNLSYDKETDAYSYLNVITVGSVEEVQPIIEGIDQIEKQYDKVRQNIIGAGCDDYSDDECNDINDKIKCICAYLKDNNSTKIYGSNKNIEILNQKIQQLEDYIQGYSTTNQEYKDVVGMDSNASYLKDSGIDTQNISLEGLADLHDYSQKKDVQNYQSIQLCIEYFLAEYDKLLSNAQELIYNIHSDTKTTYYSDDYIETQLSNAHGALERDKQTKYGAAMEIIDQKKFDATQDFDNIEYTLSGYMEQTEPLSSVLTGIIKDTDLDTNTEYQTVLNEFNTYSNTEDAYQPHYNRKNITHATRQVHPFMWNFVRYVEDSNNTDKIFYSYKVSELESAKASQYVDNILGENGNLRNMWKYNIQDFSGYTTRYVANENVTDNNTQIFEVAEYDGAFYPPAIEQYRKDYQKCINSVIGKVRVQTICNRLNSREYLPTQLSDCLSSCQLSSVGDYVYSQISGQFEDYIVDNNLSLVTHSFFDEVDTVLLSDETTGEETMTISASRRDLIDYLNDNLNKTFFERFYSNLELTQDNLDFIVKQLSDENIRNRIYEITDDQTKANVYDIYDYALDKSNNIFVLYKRYGKASPTYKEKQGALGQVWVRLKNHPIAFPLVSEQESDRDLSQIKINSSTNKYLGEILYEENITKDYCYHLEFSNDKSMLALVCKKTRREMDLDEIDPIFQKYEYASIVMSEVRSENDDKLNFKRLTLTNNDGAFDDIITGISKSNGFALPSDLEREREIYSFIGLYSPSGNKMNLVYVKKTFEYVGDGRVRIFIRGSKPFIKIQKFNPGVQGLDNGNNTVKYDGNDDNNQRILDVVFSYNAAEDRITFCYIRNLIDNLHTQKCFNKSIDMENSTEGAIIGDKFTKTMNSFDVFVQNVCTMVTTSPGNKITEMSYSESNLNADMSFIPIYPDKSKRSRIETSMKEYGCYNIELLGKERNIDSYISDTNPNPDPYFDVNSINENEKFGRVYEDYLEEYDRTFKVVENESINSNISGYCVNNGTSVKAYEWAFDIGDIEDDEIDNFKILIFNKNTLGKNPFYFGDLTSLAIATQADYTRYMDAGNTANTASGHHEYSAVGINRLNRAESSSIENNTIYNISNIRFRFDAGKRQIITVFEKEDPSVDSSINKGTVKYVLFNTRDIRVFEYYHLFDQYGLINMRYANDEYLFRNGGEYGGYKIVYDTSRYSEDYLRRRTKAYYYERLKRKDLQDLQLSDYDCLSDVYVLQDYNRLQFKYSDQDVFHISSLSYYFPTLNTKYPYTTGQLIAQHAKAIGALNEDESSTYDIFDDSNVYIINLEETKDIIDDIGDIDIPRMYNPNDCIIAFEEYLGYNYNTRVDYYDARAVQYFMFDALSASDIFAGDGTELSDLGITTTGKTSEQVLQELSEIDEGRNGLFVISAESERLKTATRYDRINLSEISRSGNQKIDIAGLTDIYVNYRRDSDLAGITLYFNYQNYLNSPFIKLDDDYRPLIDTIDGTYLKLKSGESGYLDVVIQVKHNEDNVLVGYTNIRLARYQIFNISDDKPKFILRMVNKIQKDDYTQDTSEYNSCELVVNDITVEQEQLFGYQTQKYQTQVVVGIDSGYSRVKKVDFYLFFPSEIFMLDTSRSPSGCNVAYSGDGCVHVTSGSNPATMTIPIMTVSEAFDLLARDTNLYEIFVDSASAFDKDGEQLHVNIENGTFKVDGAWSIVNQVLVNEKEPEPYTQDFPIKNAVMYAEIQEEKGKKSFLSEVKE